ncbi:MAG: hypothetical protein E6Q95_05935 [Chitinophagaceae bacterium]|nr:MAG: hypothetical protein E6Q95_05935 [Chitinophagaceae bacterium]
MKKLFILIALFSCLQSFGQVQLKGIIADTSENKKLENAVISFMRLKDSVLTTFTRSKKEGQFNLNVDTGAYIMLITHGNYADLTDQIQVRNNGVQDLGVISLLSKMKILDEVIVRGNRAIFMKGDTTIFTADSFKVAEGANVESLFKKLPGFTVDRNGKITAQGKTVEKLLVDGEEFFGSDPGIATKNLRADIVQHVQVYEGMSDQAKFTGIDDGNSKQTVNLVLKEDKKKGYFGKLEGGGGVREKSHANDNASKGRYYGTAMFNSFKAKRKLSAFLIGSNTGYLDLNWDDASKFGGSEGGRFGMMGGGGGVFMMAGSSFSDASGGGIPVNQNGGVHYSNKFNQTSINLGYKLNQNSAPGNTTVFSKTFTPDSSWVTNSNNDFDSKTLKHSGNFKLETQLDSSNSIIFRTNADFNNTKSTSNYFVENLKEIGGDLINKNSRTNTSDKDQSTFGSNLLWMHKFKKEFRSLSVNTNFNYTKSDADGDLKSNLNFYKNNLIDSVSNIDQRNQTLLNSKSFGTTLSYTEPLAKDVYLELNYGFNKNLSDNVRNVWDKALGNANNSLVDSLSNDFTYNQTSNIPGVGFRYANKKWNISLSTKMAITDYEQKDNSKNKSYDYSFTNHSPSARLTYNITPSKRIGFNYNGNSQAPSLEQLQPIRDNTDPLNEYIGNPNLNPSFDHRFSMNLNSFKMLSERFFMVGLNYGFTQNAFVSLTKIENAVRKTQTVNTNGNNNASLFLSYNKKIKPWDLRLGGNINSNYNRNISYVAGFNGTVSKNINNNYSNSISIEIGKEVDQKYDINIEPRFGYTVSKASVNTNANSNYWTIGGDINGTVYLPKEFEISSDLYFDFRQKDKRFPTNNNFTIWNAELKKWIYKKEFQLKFTVNDILNQKSGYSRNFDDYSLTETYNTILRRHFLLGFVWNFSKTGGQVKN